MGRRYFDVVTQTWEKKLKGREKGNAILLVIGALKGEGRGEGENPEGER